MGSIHLSISRTQTCPASTTTHKLDSCCSHTTQTKTSPWRNTIFSNFLQGEVEGWSVEHTHTHTAHAHTHTLHSSPKKHTEPFSLNGQSSQEWKKGCSWKKTGNRGDGRREGEAPRIEEFSEGKAERVTVWLWEVALSCRGPAGESVCLLLYSSGLR